MGLFLFVSQINPAVSAITGDKDGCRLPNEFAPWDYRGPVMPAKSPRESSVARAIEQRGYYLIGAKMDRSR